MRKSTMIWFIVGGALILMGAIIFCLLMTTLGWNFINLDTTKYNTNVYESEEVIEKVSIDTSTSDVIFKPSDNGSVKVECYEQERLNHVVSFKDGELSIRTNDVRKWHDHISLFSFKSPKITVYLPTDTAVKMNVKLSTGDVNIPKEIKLSDSDITVNTGDVEYSASILGNVKIKATTGKIHLSATQAQDVEISVSTGSIRVSDLNCKSLTVKGGSGKVMINNVTVQEQTSVKANTGDVTFVGGFGAKLCVKTNTGDVTFKRFDANEMEVNTSTGDVTGTLRTGKRFSAYSSTGDVRVPSSFEGDVCKITVSTGDIIISIVE